MSVTPEELGRQLRQPEGALGLKVAEGMNKTNAQIIQYCQEALALVDGELLLEVGPGNGAHAAELLAGLPHCRYLGLDSASAMVAAAREKPHPQLAFMEGDLLAFTPAQLFDKVLTINTAYFWQPLAPALAQLNRCLKLGGTLVLGVRSRATMAGQPQFAEGFCFFDGPELACALESCGFRVSWQKRPERSVTILGNVLEKEALIFTAIKEAAC